MDKIYCTESIVYIIVSIFLTIAIIYLIKKFVKKENTLKWIIKGIGYILFIIIIINRISISYQFLVEEIHKDVSTWWFLLPESFCGMSALGLAISVVYFKPNSRLLHCFGYFAFAGGLLASLYPTYLDGPLPFWNIRMFTGLLHHSLMVLLSILMISTGYLKPSMKRWVAIPIGYCCYMIYGLFMREFMGFPVDTMNIYVSLVGSQPILTSWYMLGIGLSLFGFIFLLFWEHFHNKKSYKIVIIEMLPRFNNVSRNL